MSDSSSIELVLEAAHLNIRLLGDAIESKKNESISDALKCAEMQTAAIETAGFSPQERKSLKEAFAEVLVAVEALKVKAPHEFHKFINELYDVYENAV